MCSRKSKDTTRSGTESTRRVWTRNSLVAAQVALSIVLLVGAGLILNSLGRLLASDVGFDPNNVLTFSFSLPAERYPDPANQLEFYRQLEERIRQVAGDRLASLAYRVRRGEWASGSAPSQRTEKSPFPPSKTPSFTTPWSRRSTSTPCGSRSCTVARSSLPTSMTRAPP